MERIDAQNWIDNYKADAEKNRAKNLQSSLMPGPWRDDDGAARAHLDGAIPTKGPSKAPRPFGGKLPVFNKCRFDTRYTADSIDPIMREMQTKRRSRKIDSRIYGSWSALPPELRYHFTEKERAALHVIASHVLRAGFCDKSVKEISDIAGIGISTVKTAMKEAKLLGLIRVQSRPRKGLNHLPSIVTIVSVKWCNWLKTLVANKSATIKNSRFKQQKPVSVEPSQGAFEREDEAKARAITIAGPAARLATAILPHAMRVGKFTYPKNVPDENIFAQRHGRAHVHGRKAF